MISSNKQFELLKPIDNNLDDLKQFIDNTNDTLIKEKITSKETIINQLLGHYNQLLVRIQDIISKDELSNFISKKKFYTTELKKIDKETSLIKRLDLLNNLYEEIKREYNILVNKVKNILTDSNSFIEYNNLVAKANENIVKINSLEIEKDIIDSLTKVYNSITDITSITKLQQFISNTNELLLNNDTINDKEGSFNDRIFNLFAKINDQIVGSFFINKDNLIYALYTLEDNSKYYAIVKNESEIKIIDQSFTTLPNLMLTKDNIINTCKIIIKNASIYYDLNEFMRYIEMSYKTKMTKEIDDLIASYKTRLTYLEENIKVQLGFIDSIALLVNHLPCDKYPNITYNDVSINEYFPNYNEENDSKLKEIERLIIEVLLNPNIKSEFNTKSILKTLYDTNTLSSLISSNYVKEDNTPIVNTSDNISNELEVTGNIKTNYDKIKDYLNMRVEELKLLESSPKINVTITKDDNNIFKDINTVLDLSTAISICNKVYKNGQGEYAVIDYLKTGNTLKFTSKYKARDLASNVDRNNYLKLLLENIFKRYLYQKDNKDFVDDILSKDSISVKDIFNLLLTNDNLLINVITNYDYEYLNSFSIKSKKIEELLSNKNDLMIVRINNILEEIKRTEKVVLDI